MNRLTKTMMGLVIGTTMLNTGVVGIDAIDAVIYKANDSINVRKSGTVSSDKVGKVFSGELVEVLSINNGWAKINYGSDIRYVDSSYLTKSTGKYVVTAKYKAAMRKSPTSKAEKITGIPRNEVINVMEIDNNWAYVKYDNKYGYVHTNNLKQKTDLYEATAALGVNVRELPSTDSTVLGKVKKGYVLNVISIKDTWAKVEYENQVGYVSTKYLNKLNLTQGLNKDNINGVYYVNSASQLVVRDGAGILNNKIDVLNNDSEVFVLDKEEIDSQIWVKIKHNNIEGWCNVENLKEVKVPEKGTYYKSEDYVGKYKTNNRSGVVLRKEPGVSKKEVGIISNNTVVNVLEKSDVKKLQPEVWVKIKYNENSVGWCNYANLSRIKSTATTEEKEEMMMIVAKEQLGKEYKFGSIGMDGFDCSGFTKYIFQKGARVNLNRFSYTQANQGEVLYWDLNKDSEENRIAAEKLIKQGDLVINTDINKVEFQFGDLLFFDTYDGRVEGINHVAMYIGNGKYIHSPKEGDVIRINDINDAYMDKTITKVTRVL